MVAHGSLLRLCNGMTCAFSVHMAGRKGDEMVAGAGSVDDGRRNVCTRRTACSTYMSSHPSRHGRTVPVSARLTVSILEQRQGK